MRFISHAGGLTPVDTYRETPGLQRLGLHVPHTLERTVGRPRVTGVLPVTGEVVPVVETILFPLRVTPLRTVWMVVLGRPTLPGQARGPSVVEVQGEVMWTVVEGF